MGCGRNDHRHLKTTLRGLLVKALAQFWGFYLTDGDHGVRGRFGELSQCLICCYHLIAKMLAVHFFRQADQPDNLVLTLLLYHIDARTRMATGTDKNQAWLAHRPIATKVELLGILTNRCDSDCATVRSILGQSLNWGNSCIKIQAGRVM